MMPPSETAPLDLLWLRSVLHDLDVPLRLLATISDALNSETTEAEHRATMLKQLPDAIYRMTTRIHNLADVVRDPTTLDRPEAYLVYDLAQLAQRSLPYLQHVSRLRAAAGDVVQVEVLALDRVLVRMQPVVFERIIENLVVNSADVQARYQQLLDLTQQVVQQAQHIQQHLQTSLQRQADRRVQRLAATLQTFIPRVEQVIRQTTRRVLQGEAVPAGEKLVSLFEPHTAIIRKGKAGKPVEFGRVLWLAETEGGIITQARILPGNPNDAAEVVPSLEQHMHQFRHPPHLLAGDGKLARRRRMNRAPTNAACNRSCCHDQGANRPRAWRMSGSAGSAGGATGGWGSKGASAG